MSINIKEKLLNEIDQTSDSTLKEVLDFLLSTVQFSGLDLGIEVRVVYGCKALVLGGAENS